MFESLDDADVRTAGTTYLMYRGRHRHEPQRDTALTRVAATLMRHAVLGPRELFYADIFASRRTGCRSNLGMPGVRDRHSGCVSSYLVEHDLFDFLLLSLPDNDWVSHKRGPEAQLQLDRAGRPAAGARDERRRRRRAASSSEHAMIVMADHSQAPVTRRDRAAGRARRARRAGAGARLRRARAASEPRIAVCPSQRAAMVYALRESERDAMRASVVARSLAIEGIDLVMWLERDAHDAPREGVIAAPGARRAALRARRRRARRARAARWNLEGSLEVLGRRASTTGACSTPDYPDALARAWSALTCPTSGEVLLSAAPGYRVHRLGPPGPRRRRQPRLAARLRLARRARAQRRRAARAPSRSSGPSATSRSLVRAHFGVAQPRALASSRT